MHVSHIQDSTAGVPLDLLSPLFSTLGVEDEGVATTPPLVGCGVPSGSGAGNNANNAPGDDTLPHEYNRWPMRTNDEPH